VQGPFCKSDRAEALATTRRLVIGLADGPRSPRQRVWRRHAIRGSGTARQSEGTGTWRAMRQTWQGPSPRLGATGGCELRATRLGYGDATPAGESGEQRGRKSTRVARAASSAPCKHRSGAHSDGIMAEVEINGGGRSRLDLGLGTSRATAARVGKGGGGDRSIQ
jgi:hypothetical protein